MCLFVGGGDGTRAIAALDKHSAAEPDLGPFGILSAASVTALFSVFLIPYLLRLTVSSTFPQPPVCILSLWICLLWTVLITRERYPVASYVWPFPEERGGFKGHCMTVLHSCEAGPRHPAHSLFPPELRASRRALLQALSLHQAQTLGHSMSMAPRGIPATSLIFLVAYDFLELTAVWLFVSGGEGNGSSW